MAIGGGLFVDRAQQVELFDNGARTHIELGGDQFGETILGDLAGAESMDHDRNRLGNADGVGHLHFATVAETGSNEILGDVTSHIGGGTVDLARVLAGEGTAAMAPHAAVGIDDDLAPGQAAIAHRAADDKTPGGVDEVAGLGIEEMGRDDLAHDLFDDPFLDALVGDFGGVLRGDDHGVDTGRKTIDVRDGDLRLGVGAEEIKNIGLAHGGQFRHQLVGELDRHRHELGGFVAGIAEHQPLIAGPLLLVQPFPFRHPLGDIGGLLVDGDEDGAGVGIEAHGRVGVADVADGLTDDLGIFDAGVGGDLAGNHGHTGGHESFAGDARFGILGQDGVEDGIGDLVGNLVGMTFADGLGSKKIIVHRHGDSPAAR